MTSKRLSKMILCARMFYGVIVIWLVFLTASVQADSYLQLGGSQESFHYKEFSNSGILLDREDGNIPGVSAEIARDQEAYSGILNIGFAGSRVAYDGRTQGGRPLVTRTKEQMLDASAILSWPGKDNAWNPRLLTGVGFRKWARDIQATSASNRLYERYQWFYWIVGFNFNMWQYKQWSVGFDWRLLRPINPSIYVEYPGYDSEMLALGAEDSIRVSVPISYQLNSKELILIESYYQTWNLAPSSSKRLYSGGSPTSLSISEPESKTEVYGIQLSLRFKY